MIIDAASRWLVDRRRATPIVWLLATFIGLAGLWREPIFFDELYHLLAARSWVEDGELTIFQGVYERTAAFTILIGTIFSWTGSDSLIVARLPALVSFGSAAALLFLILHRVSGAVPAWIGALLFMMAAPMIDLAHFARFYAPQVLLILAGSGAAFAIFAGARGASRLYLMLLAVLAWALALYLQITTLFALVALPVALLGAFWDPVRQQVFSFARARPLTLGGILLAALLLLAVIEPIAMERMGFEEAYWSSKDRSHQLFYVRNYLSQTPVLTQLFPLAILAAFQRHPRFVVFAAVMVFIPFLLHSFALQKSARYISYIFPFFVMIWALALPVIARKVEQWLAVERWRRSTVLGVPLSIIVLVATSLLFTAPSPAYASTARSLVASIVQMFQRPALLAEGPPDPPWAENAETLKRAVTGAGLLVTADDLRAILYLGGFDVVLSRTRISDIESKQEFGRDFRTGRPVVYSASAMRALVQCYPKGVVVIPMEKWRVDHQVPDETADWIERSLVRVRDAPPGFLIFRWQNERTDAACEALRQRMM